MTSELAAISYQLIRMKTLIIEIRISPSARCYLKMRLESDMNMEILNHG